MSGTIDDRHVTARTSGCGTSGARGDQRGMPRSPSLACLVLFVLAVAACGGDEQAAGEPPVPERQVANVSLAEAQSYLERDEVGLVRQALGEGRAPIAQELEPAPADSRRLAAQTGVEFDLLVFSTPDRARAAWESLLDTEVIEEGGTATRAVNLVVVFSERARRSDVRRAVRRSLRTLAQACGGDDGDPALRSLCFGDEGGVPPAGEGTDTDELAPIGASVQVGGVRYDVTIARQLNPRIEPDEELVEGYTPGDDDALLFGVFLKACNTKEQPVRPTDRLALLAAFGTRVQPVELPDGNPFAYAPRRLEPGDCLPAEGSVADRVIDGRMLLFEVTNDLLDQRPLGLEIVAPDGSERAVVQLDV